MSDTPGAGSLPPTPEESQVPSLESLVEGIHGALAGPLLSNYPLLAEEDEAYWRKRVRISMDILVNWDILGRPDSLGGTCGQWLWRLARDPLAVGLEASPGRVRLLGELVRNLARPGRINQGQKGTCSVTCLETWLADTLPGEYARLVACMCLVPGVAPLRDGSSLVRDETSLIWHRREGRRNPASRLFQVACMEYAYPNLDYRNMEDGQFQVVKEGAQGTYSGTGLDLDAFDHLLEGITGERWDTLSDKQSHMARLLEKMGLDTSMLPDLARDGLAIMEASLAENEAVFVTLDSPFAKPPDDVPEEDKAFYRLPHKVRVLKVEPGRVLYEDPLDPDRPWIPGVQTRLLSRQGHCAMPRADFQRMVVEMSYKPRFFRAPPVA